MLKLPKSRKPKIGLPVWLKNVGIKNELYFFLENLSSLLDSGLDVLTALSTIKLEVRTKRMKEVLNNVYADVDAGVPLWRSLESQRVMKEYVLSLIKVGEEAGRLVENLQVVVIQQQKERQFRSKLRSAMAYPVLVFVIATILALIMAMFVLPRLAGVFNSLTIELPITTKALILMGAFMKEYGVFVTPSVLVGMVIILWLLFGWKKTRVAGQWILFKLPGVKRLIREVELARFGHILGTLLSAGLPIVDSIKSLRDATVFHGYRRLYDHLASGVDQGEAIRQSLKEFKKSYNFIPASVQQMVVTGEQSGKLPETLENIGRLYEAKTETTSKNLTTILEPLLLIIVWFGVAGVALSVIMPIYGLLGSINDDRNDPEPAVSDSFVPQVESSPSPSPIIEEIVRGELILIDGLSALNVRQEPSTQSIIISRITGGETYVFSDIELSEEGDATWYKIEEVNGWVSADFVEDISDDEE